MQCKLIRNGIDLTETKLAYNEVVTFYFALINTYPEHVLSDDSEYSGWRAYELLSNAGSEFPLTYDIPSQLKRSAIRRAIGAWESWNTSYQKWKDRLNKKKHHKPPVQPRKFNFSPNYDAGVWKDDFDGNILLKIKVLGQWKWIKFDYQRPEFIHDQSGLNGWHKASPSIVIKANKAYLTFSLQKYIPATGGIKNQLTFDSVRVLGVDMDLDRNIAILSVLEIDANGVVAEVARHFIKQSNHTKRRKRRLGQIATRMQKTGIINKGFCNRRWEQIRNSEREMGRKVARQITNFARDWKCSVIAFEHLSNLKPCRGKYSRRSNQKRAYWLKSKVFQETSRVAYQDYGILTKRVNPRNTSRLDPWNNELYRINLYSGEVAIRMIHDGGLEPKYEPGADFVVNPKNCYSAHSGLNAARNIGLKAILLHRTNAVFVLRKA